jgi:hypothetical protein
MPKRMTSTSNSVSICVAHEGLMEIIMEAQKKEAVQSTLLEAHAEALKQILAAQKEHSEQLSTMNRIVTNGLQSNVIDIKASMEGLKKDFNNFCDFTRTKLDEFDDFTWFRKAVNKFRDRIFFKLFLLLLLIIVILTFLHFSPVLSMLLKLVEK